MSEDRKCPWYWIKYTVRNGGKIERHSWDGWNGYYDSVVLKINKKIIGEYYLRDLGNFSWIERI